MALLGLPGRVPEHNIEMGDSHFLFLRIILPLKIAVNILSFIDCIKQLYGILVPSLCFLKQEGLDFEPHHECKTFQGLLKPFILKRSFSQIC
jgi:hypothetical protein